MITQQAQVKPQTSYFPIHLEAIRIDTILEFDLFIRINNQMVLYRSTEMPFTDRTLQKLVDNKVERLYITNEKIEFLDQNSIICLSMVGTVSNKKIQWLKEDKNL